ncbi:uncharacterized protein LOC110977800 [Acanthaster planci]|uniref:Uncharacterized protein LOC110977800 n=1 Tax=Acanthaster planci TaxID=133434 RepID=A0A8B7Y6G0_ACAPL|nr:uncharacterized protein LOC110977800 [Acanthaster planci]
MWTPRSGPRTPHHGKTLQEILDALTRPNKWMSDPLTATSASRRSDDFQGDATWVSASVTMSGSPYGDASTGRATRAWPLSVTVTSNPGTISPTSLGRDVTGMNGVSEFWYRYGISITVAFLVLAVAFVLVIQCRILYKKKFRRRRLVDLAENRNNKAREDVFESFHRQETVQASTSRSRLQSASTHEDIPMRLLHDAQPYRQPWRAPPAGRAAEPLARVYPIQHRGPARDVNANITDPFPYESYRRLWNITTGAYPIRTHRKVLSEPTIARPSSRRYFSRSRSRSHVRRVRVRADIRMPRFNLSGTRVVTSPESNGNQRLPQRNISAQVNRTTFAEPNTLLTEVNTPTPKLIVPTNTPNTHCTDSAPDENASPYGPGLDSDFGASAGIPHFTVSPDNSMNATGDTSLRDATYEWDTYDPAYMNRTVRYIDGAYFPVLQKRQYWV